MEPKQTLSPDEVKRIRNGSPDTLTPDQVRQIRSQQADSAEVPQPETEQAGAESSESNEIGKWETIRRNLLQGLTFGQADEIGGALYGAFDVATDPQLDWSDYSNRRKQYTAQIREMDEQADRENPWTAGLSEVGGSVVSGGYLLKGVSAIPKVKQVLDASKLKAMGKAASKGGKQLGQMAPEAVSELAKQTGKGTVGKLVTGGVLAAEGAATGIGKAEDTNNLLSDATQGALYNIGGAGVGHIAGKAVGAGAKALKEPATTALKQANKYARKAIGMVSTETKKALIAGARKFGIEATDKSIDDLADEFTKYTVDMGGPVPKQIVESGDSINSINEKVIAFLGQAKERLTKFVNSTSERYKKIPIANKLDEIAEEARSKFRADNGEFTHGPKTTAALKQIDDALGNAKQHITDPSYVSRSQSIREGTTELVGNKPLAEVMSKPDPITGKVAEPLNPQVQSSKQSVVFTPKDRAAAPNLDARLGGQKPTDGTVDFNKLWGIRQQLGKQIEDARVANESTDALSGMYNSLNNYIESVLKSDPKALAEWNKLNRQLHVGLTFKETVSDAALKANNSITSAIKSSDISLMAKPFQVLGIAATRAAHSKYGYAMASDLMGRIHEGLAKSGQFLNSRGVKLPDRFSKELTAARAKGGAEAMTRAAIKLWGTEPEFRQQYSDIYDKYEAQMLKDAEMPTSIGPAPVEGEGTFD